MIDMKNLGIDLGSSKSAVWFVRKDNLGIDFGTSNSSVAMSRPGSVATALKIDGSPTSASIVMVRKEGPIAGTQAKNRSSNHAHETIRSVKRLIGEANLRWNLHGTSFTPCDVVRLILSRVKNAAELQLTSGLAKARIGRVAITTPAAFNESQKKVLLDAARMVGFDDLCLVNDGVAVALALPRGQDTGPIFIFGLGGGFLNVTIARIAHSEESSRYDFLADEGLCDLGGDDFDRAIMELAAGKLEEKCGIDIREERDSDCEFRALAESRQDLKNAAEWCKRELSEPGVRSVMFTVPLAITDRTGKRHPLEFELTLDQFNDRIQPGIRRALVVVDAALDRAGLRVNEISRIILVGGSSRVPLVRQLLRERFQKEPLSDVSFDSAGCRGAAIFAAGLDNQVQGAAPIPMQNRIELLNRRLVTRPVGSH
jgi:molecular chaperone DnaK